VIASSGTAFTELQAKLLGRFSKNVVVNFDPDTDRSQGYRAPRSACSSKRNSPSGFLRLRRDSIPTLFIRRKGKDAYGAALKNSQKYFDYLIDRARAMFRRATRRTRSRPSTIFFRTFRGCPTASSAMNWLWKFHRSWEIDSAVLRQELKHAATNRSTTQVKATAEAQITGAERVLIRALSSATEMQSSGARKFGSRRGR